MSGGLIYLAIINSTGFFLAWADKRKAEKGGRRIAERTLFLTALLGGSAGLYTAMLCFRHKTKKLRFTAGIPVIILLQMFFGIWLAIQCL